MTKPKRQPAQRIELPNLRRKGLYLIVEPLSSDKKSSLSAHRIGPKLDLEGDRSCTPQRHPPFGG